MPEPLDLDRLETLARAATPGPWRCWDAWRTSYPGEVHVHRIGPDAGGGVVATNNADLRLAGADAEYIAAADPQTLLALVGEVRRLRERAASDVEFRASIIQGLLDALGITDDTTPEDARQILDGCDCDGEEGTLHLIWHLGQKPSPPSPRTSTGSAGRPGLQELGTALGLPLGEHITGAAGVEAAERLRAERDNLAANVAAVEALVDRVEHRMMATARPDEIREALEVQP